MNQRPAHNLKTNKKKLIRENLQIKTYFRTFFFII